MKLHNIIAKRVKTVVLQDKGPIGQLISELSLSIHSVIMYKPLILQANNQTV